MAINYRDYIFRGLSLNINDRDFFLTLRSQNINYRDYIFRGLSLNINDSQFLSPEKSKAIRAANFELFGAVKLLTYSC
jgi:hypothetical protein